MADQRLREWSKDQEEFTEKQYQEVQRRLQEQKEPRAKEAVDPGPRKLSPKEQERQGQEARERSQTEQRREEEMEKLRREARRVEKEKERQKEELELIREVGEKYREPLTSTLTRLKEVEKELAEIRTTRRNNAGLPWPKVNELIERSNRLAKEEREILRERETLVRNLDTEREERIKAMKYGWQLEDEQERW
jgi:hypothetical protein